jgi:hypothetical protein
MVKIMSMEDGVEELQWKAFPQVGGEQLDFFFIVNISLLRFPWPFFMIVLCQLILWLVLLSVASVPLVESVQVVGHPIIRSSVGRFVFPAPR